MSVPHTTILTILFGAGKKKRLEKDTKRFWQALSRYELNLTMLPEEVGASCNNYSTRMISAQLQSRKHPCFCFGLRLGKGKKKLRKKITSSGGFEPPTLPWLLTIPYSTGGSELHFSTKTLLAYLVP
jgi:hypothetical protein